MSVTALPVGQKQLPSLALRRFSWGVLAYFVAVILWGRWCAQPGPARAVATIGRCAMAR